MRISDWSSDVCSSDLMCRPCFAYLTTVRRDRIGILRTTGPVARIGGNNPPPGRLRIEYGVGVRAPAVVVPRATRRAPRRTMENYDPFGFVGLTQFGRAHV